MEDGNKECNPEMQPPAIHLFSRSLNLCLLYGYANLVSYFLYIMMLGHLRALLTRKGQPCPGLANF